ncbi:MAG: sigma-70 family RNA polymerase sigma factor [Terracidiphilus sp.]|nr:sigma-70 family RNA polymerase sigma factor [Terracidiphilus sp.]
MPAQTVTKDALQDTLQEVLEIDSALMDTLWRESQAEQCGLGRKDLNAILLDEAARQENAAEILATRQRQAEFFGSLRLADLVLARVCARGCERAWARFLELYRQPLTRAAIAIAGSETLGHDLAGQLYGDLYGLAGRDGVRRCPLDSYRGRGSLMGWLRTTLAQRHVDHYRRTRREEPLEEFDAPAPTPEPAAAQPDLALLKTAVAEALAAGDAEEKFLLASYYLEGRKLLSIARVCGVHESTISRKLARAVKTVRKRILKRLQAAGMSKQAAEEMLGADPRDVDLNLKNLMQNAGVNPFQEETAR